MLLRHATRASFTRSVSRGLSRQRHGPSASRLSRSFSAGDGKEPAPSPVDWCFKRVALIGAGQMAEAILEAIAAKSLHPMSGISVYDINKDRLALFESKFGTKSHSDIETAVADADLVVLAIKPQNVPTVSKALRGKTRPAAVLLSIVAGVGIDEFAESTGVRKIVRTMPNTPATIQEGMTVWTSTSDLTLKEKNSVASLLECMGLQQYVTEEGFLDMATAVSGSGPAYVLLVIEALIDVSVHLGFPRQMAEKLVLQTVMGTTLYAMRSGKHPAILRNQITSPGGTTASALYVLERGIFRTVLADGLWAAYRRSLELGGKDSNVGPGRYKLDLFPDKEPERRSPSL